MKIVKRTIFKTKLPTGMHKKGTTFSTVCGRASISWNNKLRNTAGRCRMGIERLRSADVTLSSKRKFMIELAPHILGSFSKYTHYTWMVIFEPMYFVHFKITIHAEWVHFFENVKRPWSTVEGYLTSWNDSCCKLDYWWKCQSWSWAIIQEMGHNRVEYPSRNTTCYNNS